MWKLLTIPLFLFALVSLSMVLSRGGTAHRAEFAFINRGDIYTLDLNQMSYNQDLCLTYAIREGLYVPHHDTYKPVPAGAVGHELSDDKRVWTFKLRKEALWSNGDRVTAHDYEFSWRLMLEDPGQYTYLFGYIKGAEAYKDAFAAGTGADWRNVGIEALDDHTLRVTLNDPVTFFLELLAFPPFYPRHAKSMEPFKESLPGGKVTYRADYTKPAPGPGQPGVVTNGPYVLTRWEFKRRLVLERSENYWDRANVRSGTIEMVVNDVHLNQFLMYEAGAIDWIAELPGDLAKELRNKNRPDVRSAPAFGTAFLTLLVRPELPESIDKKKGRNPLADMRVRQALAMSIDKSFITNHLTRVGELPARTYLPPDGTLDFRWLPGVYDKTRKADQPYTPEEVRSLSGDLRNPAGPGLPYDVDEARRLLADAGYPGGSGFPVLPIYCNTNSDVRVKLAQVLKSQWKEKLGIEINLQQFEPTGYREKVDKKDYVIGPVSWYGDYPDASTFTDKYLSMSLQNDSDWQNKQFDELCAKAAKEADPVKRTRLLSEAEHLIDTEVPIIPLYHYVNVSLARDNVRGVKASSRNLTMLKAVKVER